MAEELLNEIAQFIYHRSRLIFPGHKISLLRKRLEGRRMELNLPDLAAYHEFLRISAEEEAILVDQLTTNETSFFRNPKQFDYLMGKIVPELELRRGKEVINSWGKSEQVAAGSIMKLRILCAGCSTGEEPYSVAMALLESLRYPRAWNIEILAGDISTSCIRVAETGFFEEDRLKGIPSSFRQKYLTRVEGGAVVRDDVKKLIRFCRMNLKDVINGEGLQGTSGGYCGFDIIFCRNVMIYFSVDSQQLLVDALFHALLPGGYLFTGDAEPLHLYDHDFATVHDAGCLIYKKMENR